MNYRNYLIGAYHWYFCMSIAENRPVKLTRPTDFVILDALSDGWPDVGANISQRIDKDRQYVNTRLTHLEDYGLVERLGPAENTGLYRITPRGVAALKLRDRYDSDGFDDRVDRRAERIDIQPPEIVDRGGGSF